MSFVSISTRLASVSNTRVGKIFLLALISLACFTGNAQAQTSIGTSDGHVTWEGWDFSYETFVEYDGLNLYSVSYDNNLILNRASFPVMTVYYDGPCGPYADRLNGPQAAVTWADDAILVAREFTQGTTKWFELGIREFIGSYDIYQVWYFSEHGQLDAHIFSRGLQCNYFHVHHPMWRFDFDIDGFSGDLIYKQTDTGTLTQMTNEFEAPATDAAQHGWYVADNDSGIRVHIGFDNGAWNVSGVIVPESDYENNLISGVQYKREETTWVGPADPNLPYVEGEPLTNQDIAVWYKGYMPHSPDEGAALWHSTGVRLTVESNVDTDGDGIFDYEDTDDDNDGVPDINDAFPHDASESVDTDSDGIGNNADDDDDNDGYPDANDQFPLSALEHLDTDGDGTGDNADPDADNDGISDLAESASDVDLLVLEDFETLSGWTRNANGTDNATHGLWAIGDPEPTVAGSVSQISPQLGVASNGTQALVTDPLAGDSAGDRDVDAGVTTMLSPLFDIPANAVLLMFDYYVGYLPDTSNDDYLRVELLTDAGSQTLLEHHSDDSNQDAVWTTSAVDARDLAGQSVRFLVTAADEGINTLWEAGFDYIRVSLDVGLDTDNDGVENALDLDSDNDAIGDVIEAGLADTDYDFRIDSQSLQASVTNPPDSDADGTPDVQDLESHNAANDGTDLDIDRTAYADLDTSNNGQVNDMTDLNGNGVDDRVEEARDTCGAPAIDTGSDRALFTWVDCDGRINILGIGANGSASYAGAVATDGTLANLQTESLESSDTVTLSSASRIDFNLRMGGIYTDAFSFTKSDGASVCIDVSEQSADTQLLAGRNRVPVTAPFDPVTLASCTMPDNGSCGSPEIDPEADPGLFIWQACSGETHVMMTGNSTDGHNSSLGRIEAANGISAVNPISLESSDTAVIGTGGLLNFDLTTSHPWEDSFSFSPDGDVCVEISETSGLNVYAGPNRAQVNPQFAFNPVTLAICSIDATSCTAPTYDAGTDRALFTWVGCDGKLNVVATGGSTSATYSGFVFSSNAIDGFSTQSIESSDTVNQPGATSVFFDIGTGGGWTDGFIANSQPGDSLCIELNYQSDGTQLLFGSNRSVASSPFDPVTGQSCTPPSSDCGSLNLDTAVDLGFFIWKSCDDTWHVLVTGDDTATGSAASYTGAITTSTGLVSVDAVSLEASDTLSSTASTIDFTLKTSTPWSDQFDFKVNSGDDICVTITDMSASVGRYAGVDKTPVEMSFNPVTMQACQ